MRFKCKVITRSSKNEIYGIENLNSLDLKFKKNEKDLPVIRAYLTAVPVKGKANKELIKLLAKEFNLGKNKINIIKGEKSKEKIIEINDKI